MKLTKLFLLITMLSSALILLTTSCNTASQSEEMEELDNAAATNEEEEAAPERYEYYLDSEQVAEDTFDPASEEYFIAVTGEPDPEVTGGGLIKVWAFSSEEEYIEWGEFYGMPVACRLKLENHLRDYAVEIGAIDYYEETGEVMAEYEAYATEYTANMDCRISLDGQRLLGMVHRDFFWGASWLIGPHTFVMAPGWNNQVSRYVTYGAFNGFTVFDRNFYRNRMATLWNWGWTNWRFWFGLRFLNDRTSSCMLI